MPLPTPEPGLVLSYGYLWLRERAAGVVEGRKARPVVVVLAVRKSPEAPPRLTVAPVTHAPPQDPHAAIAIPPRVKAALGLDDQPSWVVLDEVNQFDWPGFDVRPIPGRRDQFAYGFLPPALYARIVERIRMLAAQRRLHAVPRED